VGLHHTLRGSCPASGQNGGWSGKITPKHKRSGGKGPQTVHGGGGLDGPLCGPRVGRENDRHATSPRDTVRNTAPPGEQSGSDIQNDIPRGGDGPGGTAPTGAHRDDVQRNFQKDT